MARVGKWAGTLLAALTLAWAGMAGAAPEKGTAEEAPAVTVQRVRTVEVNPAAEFVGRVEAIQAVD
ncbi:MAG: hypothetical protein ABIK12_16980, partial [Pseudomonadota bacterium]